MKKLLSVTIPKMFEGVQTYGTRFTPASGPAHEQKHIVHLDCDTSFWVDEPIRYNYYFGEVESIPTCPHCGQHVLIRSVIGKDEDTPISAKFTVYECKDFIQIRINYRVVVMHDWGTPNPHEYTTRREVIRFHVDTGISTLTIIKPEGRTVQCITNPFDMGLYEDSYLAFFNRGNLTKDFRKELSQVLTTTRRAIAKKFQQLHGFPLKNMYVSRSEGEGYLYYPILNMAFRLSCPDMKNLPASFAVIPYKGARHLRANVIGLDEEGLQCLDAFFHRDAYKTRNPMTDLLQSFSLEDTPFNRRVLAQDMFSVGRLKQIQNLTRNPDFQHLLYQRVRGENAYHDLQCLLQLGFSEQKMANLVRACFNERGQSPQNAGWSFPRILHYAKTMWKYGSPIRLAKAPSNPAKLEALMSREVFRVEHPNDVLPVPDDIRKRLTSQVGDSRFYLPQTTWQLKSAADAFHNCVFSYCQSLMNQECRIVLMADINGALAACLEVRGGELVQAKLRFNKPVSDDPVVNDAVLAWCERTGLPVHTNDVRRFPVEERISEGA